jgi:hypothetical protein
MRQFESLRTNMSTGSTVHVGKKSLSNFKSANAESFLTQHANLFRKQTSLLRRRRLRCGKVGQCSNEVAFCLLQLYLVGVFCTALLYLRASLLSDRLTTPACRPSGTYKEVLSTQNQGLRSQKGNI